MRQESFFLHSVGLGTMTAFGQREAGIRETGFPHECLHRESVRDLEKGVGGPPQAGAILCIAPTHHLLPGAHKQHHGQPWSQKMYQSTVQGVITCD